MRSMVEGHKPVLPPYPAPTRPNPAPARQRRSTRLCHSTILNQVQDGPPLPRERKPGPILPCRGGDPSQMGERHARVLRAWLAGGGGFGK